MENCESILFKNLKLTELNDIHCSASHIDHFAYSCQLLGHLVVLQENKTWQPKIFLSNFIFHIKLSSVLEVDSSRSNLFSQHSK